MRFSRCRPLFFLIVATAARADDWPAWRGSHAIGVCDETNLPTHWSSTENVRWRVTLPEPGNSTPIVSRGRVFVTQAVGRRRTLMCFNRKDGKLLWQRGIDTTHDEPTHATNPYCAASPVTDGERVIASFASDGLYCWDFEGNELWRRTDLGDQVHIWGAGTSPTLYEDLCFLDFGPGATTYLLAVDKNTGRTIWKRDEDTGYGKPPTDDVQGKKNQGDVATFVGSWTTPTIMRVEGRHELLMSWPRRLAAYDPRSGDELWSCTGLNPLVYTSPIYSDDIVVAMGGFNGQSIALRAGGSGDITDSRRLWHHPKTMQRIGSGVIKDGYIFVHNDPGIAECYHLRTGELVWTHRLSGNGAKGTNWSSVMLSGDRCYTMTQGGDCFVFRASPEFELIAVNTIGEHSNSSVIASDGELFLRTYDALWCVNHPE